MSWLTLPSVKSTDKKMTTLQDNIVKSENFIFFFLITVRPLIKYAKVKLRGLAALNGVKVSFAVRGIVLD